MYYEDNWNEMKDVRWLIYMVYHNKRLYEDYGVNLGLRNFVLSATKDVNKMSGKVNSLYENVKYMTTVNILTGLEGLNISERRRRYFNDLTENPIGISDTYEYNVYFAALDEDSTRAAYYTYISAIQFIKNLSGNNENVVNDFREKLAKDFKEFVAYDFQLEDAYDLCPKEISEMYKQSLYPAYASNSFYFDGKDENGNKCKKFHGLWEKENNIRWLIYLLFKSGVYKENHLRQYALDVLLKLISKFHKENLFDVFRDEISMIQDCITGIVSREEVVATSKKDNIMGYNPFGRIWNDVRASLNSMKFANAESAICYAFYFMLDAGKSYYHKNGGEFAKFSDELAADFKKEFGNPFDNFFNLNISFEGITNLINFNHIPLMKNGKWYFEKKNCIGI